MLPSLPFLVKRDIPAESIPARSRYQNFREAKASGTAVLIVVNLYIFFVRVQEPNLVTWGGNLGKLTLNGEAWRLVTAMFLHASLVHLAGNLICLWAWGRVTEAALGTARFLLAYFASGVLANLAGAWVHPDVISVGASGAIAGILGLMVVIWLKGDARIG